MVRAARPGGHAGRYRDRRRVRWHLPAGHL